MDEATLIWHFELPEDKQFSLPKVHAAVEIERCQYGVALKVRPPDGVEREIFVDLFRWIYLKRLGRDDE